MFGLSTPLAKLLLGQVAPIPMAALLYLGAGLAMALFKGARRLAGQPEAEAPLSRKDLPWLVGAILAGGVAAPIVLLFSLQRTPAATASLLLNFEGVATALLAALIFKEAIGTRVWWAIGAVTTASILLSWDTDAGCGISLGALGVLAACVLWGLDNNLTRSVSAKDPLAVVMYKGLGAGAFSLILGRATDQPLPRWAIAVVVMALGIASYGASVALYVLALRGLGAARTSALFGTAPFMGAALSLVIFRASPGMFFVASVPLMVAGAVLVLGEKHHHAHVHEALDHDHRHRHDDGHHLHRHPGMALHHAHSHLHRHEPITHAHPHVPDIHHRHRHLRASGAVPRADGALRYGSSAGRPRICCAAERFMPSRD